MTYFNPRIYNYHNLKEEDKKVVDGMIYLVDSLENMEADYLGYEDETTMEKIQNEIALETLQEAQERLKYDIAEFMVAMIENYDEDVEEIDTDNYFYGCPLVKDDEDED